jgi:SAM-dependent methyltransferase
MTRVKDDAGVVCHAGCPEPLEAMGRWAPYSICTSCGSASWIPPAADDVYWGQRVQPSAAQDAAWSGRDALRLATVGEGPGRLLDVGCGFGHFVRWAIDHGWDAWSAEQDPWAREAAVVAERIVEDPFDLDGDFDTITLWDVLEHTTRPVELAGALLSRLRPGGRLFVCSPNFAAMKLRWPFLRYSPARFNDVVRPLEHATQFTEIGIVRTLERAGLVGAHIVRPPLASRDRSVLNLLARRVPSLRRGLFASAYAP